MATQTKQKQKLGEAVWGLAQGFSTRMNECEFGTTLLSGQMPLRRYLGYIVAMYPIVVGFNRVLIKGLAKVDHVRQGSFVRALAQQLLEEQGHNQLWRGKLSAFGIDHEALYQTLLDYLARFSAEELERMTLQVLAHLRNDLTDVSPGCFPRPPFPEPVLALYHHLWMTASYESISHWEHFASQASIEFIIFNVVSASIYPGVVGTAQLDRGPATTVWWKEHAKQGSAPGRRSDEEKHLEISRHALNRNGHSDLMAAQITMRAEDTMRLFAATFICHDIDKVKFSVEPYLRETVLTK